MKRIPRVTQKNALEGHARPEYRVPTDAMGREIRSTTERGVATRLFYRGGLGEVVWATVVDVDLLNMRVVVQPYRIAGVNYTGYIATLRRWDKALIVGE